MNKIGQKFWVKISYVAAHILPLRRHSPVGEQKKTGTIEQMYQRKLYDVSGASGGCVYNKYLAKKNN